LRDASARISIEAITPVFSMLSTEELLDVNSAYAKDIASACGVAESSVVDLQGNKATVTIAGDGSINAFVLKLSGSSANDLAAKLYSSTFQSALVNSTLAVVGGAAGASVRPMLIGAVTFQPEKFVPLLPTTTRTKTSTATSTATSTSSITGAETSTTSIMAEQAIGADSAGKKDQPADSGPAWWWFAVGAAVAGGAVAACALATQKRRHKSLDVAGSQV